MAIDKDNILDNSIEAITSDGRYVDGDGELLEGDELADAQAATRTGLAYIVDAMIDEVKAELCVPRFARIDGSFYVEKSGGSRPAAKTIQAVDYFEFDVGAWGWPHFTLPFDVDTDADVTVVVDFFPIVSEASRKAKFELDYLPFHDNGDSLNAIDGTISPAEIDVPATAWIGTGLSFVIPASAIDPNDHEIHSKIKRVASTNDPTDLGVHHIYAIVQLKPLCE